MLVPAKLRSILANDIPSKKKEREWMELVLLRMILANDKFSKKIEGERLGLVVAKIRSILVNDIPCKIIKVKNVYHLAKSVLS